MAVGRLVAASRETVSEAVSSHPQKMSCPTEILSDEEVFHRRESCFVCHFVLPSDLHD